MTHTNPSRVSAAPRDQRFAASAGLASWLHETRISLAFSTYEFGKLLFVGAPDPGSIALFDRTIPRCMGLHLHGERLHVASRSEVLRFRDAGAEGRFDRRFLPRMSWYTGDIDAHDVSVDAHGRPLVVATGFNAVVRVSEDRSFEPVWWPPFMDGPMPGDRCHLNGLATRDGSLALVTYAGASADLEGWRRSRLTGGVVWDVQADRALASGLCLPHSPRLYDDQVWFLEAGRGRLCVIDGEDVRTVAELPGFARGLSFVDGYAIVGLSAPRTDDAIRDLPLQDRTARQGVPLICGIAVVDLSTGAIAHVLAVDGQLFREVYDVVAVPGARSAMAVGFRNDEILKTFDLDLEPHKAAAAG